MDNLIELESKSALEAEKNESCQTNNGEDPSSRDIKPATNISLTVTDVNKDDSNTIMDKSNIHYEGDICVYTDPTSKCQYTWDSKNEKWSQRNETFDSKNYKYDGTTYSYVDEQTNKTLIWDVKTNSWTEKNDERNNPDYDGVKEKQEDVTKQDMSKGHYGFENDTHTYTDPSDGTVYLWDKEKSAWFPKVDDNFLAHYQLSYGFVDNETDDKETEVELKAKQIEEQKLELKRKAPSEPTWFDVGEDSTKVYVSNLPLDLTETEFIDFMQKCGLVMKDIDTGKMKVKLYTEPKTGFFKGDALCTYIKKESVKLALDLLDGYTFKEKKIKVERAKFTMKGETYDASLKPKKKKKKDKEKIKKMQEKLFDWRPDKLRNERSKNEKVVIVKNLFNPEMFDKNVGLILEYQQDLREESIKCGSVQRVIIYDRHPEGVAQINFKEFEAADACVQLLNNRWFGQRQITAELWDGKTKYKVSETKEEADKRLEGWSKFLEEKDKEEQKSAGHKNKESTVQDQPEVEYDSDETRGSAGSQDLTDEEK
uniref:RRM domain-containing protein n=2 Tax=Clastoptera arizonana TaxID=38151 RepID=A0A1B6CZN8_9HEMI